MKKLAKSPDSLSKETQDLIGKLSSASARESMTKDLQGCAKAAASKLSGYHSWHSTARAFKVLQCVSLLDPRNVVKAASQSWSRMAESFRGSWRDSVDECEWNRYRGDDGDVEWGASDFPDLPTKASEVITWWTNEKVVEVFPTLSSFVLEIVRLLPRSAENG